MDGASGPIAIELRQVQRLGHYALSRERRVTVYQQRNDSCPLGVAQPVLLRPDDALHHGVDSFEVARIRSHRHHNVAPGICVSHAARTQMIFHVARTLCAGRIDIPFELGEDLY